MQIKETFTVCENAPKSVLLSIETVRFCVVVVVLKLRSHRCSLVTSSSCVRWCCCGGKCECSDGAVIEEQKCCLVMMKEEEDMNCRTWCPGASRHRKVTLVFCIGFMCCTTVIAGNLPF